MYLFLLTGTVFSCKPKTTMDTNNPLLNDFNTLHQTAPFSRIKTEHFEPAFLAAMDAGRKDIDAIINNTAAPDFQNTIVALENAGSLLSRTSKIFFNLNSAATDDSIQAIARRISPKLAEYGNDISLNEKLFARVKMVYDNLTASGGFEQLTKEQQMLLQKCYRSFVRNGALLSGEAKEKYREVTAQLSMLSVEFGEKLLAETVKYKLHITNEADMSGLPAFAREAAAAAAQNNGLEGWVFTLDAPSYGAFMKYADNRALREELYRAYSSRCNHGDELDNKENILKQTALKLEMAKLLGFETYSEYELEERMAQTPERVYMFLDQLLEASYPYAAAEVKEVSAFAAKQGLKGELQRWDFPYYSEKLKASKFDLTDEMTKPYFELERVINGVFGLTGDLWGLTYKLNPEIQVYHPDARAYEVFDNDGSYLAVLYLDFHPRNSKQGGAWMTDFRDQSIANGNNIRPHISVVCNFTAPVDGNPALLTHSEVETFLHEFGHALHGMLSNVTYASLAGTNVYRDFVELPSQIMENWALEKEWLQKVGIHYQTQDTIPDALINKIINAGNFQSGYLSVRQLSFGFNDMDWHTITAPVSESVEAFERSAMAKTELFPDVAGTCMSTAFSHIFNGGYASGYYGYKWAEVLDADAFDLFKTSGIFDRATAESYRSNILSKGGTEPPMELYIRFRGHEPSIQPLLNRSGLVK